MPRRGARDSPVVSDDDSLKENRDIAAPNNKRAKTGQMATLNGKRPSRKARVESDDDQETPQTPDAAADEDADADADADGDEDVEEEGGSPKGTKRARTNTIGDSAPGLVEQERKLRVVTQPRDTDGYIPGSIVRIQLKNFVTYDYVEFRPGPYLNMILGPNGTGKSSIACAICLGLNFPASTLGRASDVNLFVKNTTDSGHIEIELKGSKGKPNLVIRRSMTARSKSSSFTLNDKPATGREVTDQVARLNVQVGNLCSFLPQDKVSQFAQMTPQQLLKETQRAAGNENLTAWHETLVSSGKELKVMQESLEADRSSLKTMQDRNAALEKEVERFRERKRIEENIELLEILIPVQEYREKRARFLKLKEKQRTLHAKCQRLKARNAPAQDLQKKLEKRQQRAHQAREDKKKEMAAKVKKTSGLYDRSNRLEKEAEELQDQLKNLKTTEKERLSKIKQYEKTVADTTKALKEHKGIEVEDGDALKEQANQTLRERQAKVVTRYDAVQEKQASNADKEGELRSRKTHLESNLKKLDDVNEQRLRRLFEFHRETAEAVQWLRRNKDLFRMPVMEPPFISIDIPRKEFASAVESMFSAAQLKTFVAQCQEDYDTLNKHLNDEKCLGRPVQINTWFRNCNPNRFVPPPMTPEELKSAGFAGYAIDFITCPDGLKTWLTHELGFHRNAIGLRNVNVQLAMELVSRIGPHGEGGGATFIAGTAINNVGRSKYGRRALFNDTRELRQAKVFVMAPVDGDLKKKMMGEIGQIGNELQMIQESNAMLEKEEAQIKQDDQVFKTKLDDFKKRQRKIQDYYRKLDQMQGRIESTRINLDRLLNAPSTEDKKLKLQKELVQVVRKRVQLIQDYAQIAREIVENNEDATRAGLQDFQLRNNVRVLKDMCEKADAQVQAAMMEYAQTDELYRKVKAESHVLLETFREIINNMEPDSKARYEAVELPRQAYDTECIKARKEGKPIPPVPEGMDQRTSNEMRDDLENEKAKLALNDNTNQGVIEAYDRRKRDIESLSGKIEEKEQKLARVERQIKVAKDNWHPALKALVESIGRKFSAAFDRIGCAGEIRIGEHEDFDKWTIDILVKFRSEERLQILTAQRQSGGERSLTTILYLMSLTEEARAPFSLVDEINQGMDARAERVVHNSMVEVTCQEDSAQYFLITPKLLADLQYHDRMKVLCVNNGEWLPDENEVGNMRNLIEGYARLKASKAPANAV